VDTFERWLATLKPNTRLGYGQQLRRLFAESNMTGDQILESVKSEARSNSWDTYVELRQICKGYKPTIAHAMFFALRRYLYDNGVITLPPAKMQGAPRAKLDVPMTWEQAHAVCAAAAKPYSLVYKMMLNCGWGIGQFFTFNTPENWARVKEYLSNPTSPEFYKFDFLGRKSNRSQWYSLVPKSLLQEIVSTVDVPIRADHGRGIPLDMPHYRSARTYVESSWKTAVRRASVKLPGAPPPHELRDTFRTRCQRVGCDPVAAEWAMGHSIDPLGYNKIYGDVPWVWDQLKKVYTANVVSKEDFEAQKSEIVRLREELALFKHEVQKTWEEEKIEAWESNRFLAVHGRLPDMREMAEWMKNPPSHEEFTEELKRRGLVDTSATPAIVVPPPLGSKAQRHRKVKRSSAKKRKR